MAFIIDKSDLKALNRKTAERLRSNDRHVRRDAVTGKVVGREVTTGQVVIVEAQAESRGRSTAHATGPVVTAGEFVKTHNIVTSKSAHFTTKDIRNGLMRAKKMISGMHNADDSDQYGNKKLNGD